MRQTLYGVPKEKGLQFTIGKIKALILKGRKDQFVRHFTNKLLQGVLPRDTKGEIKALVKGVIRKVRFVKDPWRVETLQSASNTINLGYGDCDDFVILLGSMIMSIGHRVRLVTAGFMNPTHIYLEVLTPKGWAPVDATIEKWSVAPPLPVIKRYDF